MIIIFQIIRRVSDIRIEDRALFKIAELIAYAMFNNLFLLSAEIYIERAYGWEEEDQAWRQSSFRKF
jgi:hypothetical protein